MREKGRWAQELAKDRREMVGVGQEEAGCEERSWSREAELPGGGAAHTCRHQDLPSGKRYDKSKKMGRSAEEIEREAPTREGATEEAGRW
jgi:hypothetical protein